ncbi:lytic transglycosylase domain-containing protein [Streptomyces sporangiiformans]|uniref:Lytic transglycosylase domain-containing protein n=1 Tax=Streptomyces sporangiiformans TaxID=2315329 RepID=A0A505D2L2_9ACTN|nr:lytic transglycosylase domain-containing protein [Streptomyces sporangiiformans]TPQ18693.1 lytic transglycosylase domain-containing protein [Streptomyces sporangiiformans]
MAAQFGRRLAKGAATTAVAAAAVAALSASQAPGVTDTSQGRQNTGSQPSPDVGDDTSATGNSPYYTDLPPLNSPAPTPGTGTPTGTGDVEAGIPATVLDAYKKAEAALREDKPGCNLPWELLAAIGKVESGQARGGRVDADGTTLTPILGPVLNGNGFQKITDTDGGSYDGDTAHDRAVGPMQFIPSTWAWSGRDGNGDGEKDPNNIYDAALAAGHYLCRADRDLSVEKDLNRAILSYNHSTDYLNLVLTWLEYYRKGTHEVPDGTGSLPSGRSDDYSGASPTPTPPSRTPGTSKPSTPPSGGGSTSPSSPASPSSPPPSTTPPPSSPPPTGTDTVDHLENAGTGKLTATAGDAFTERIATRAETKAGKAVPKVRVRFTIVGDTDAAFSGGESVATVLTNSSGVATAPALRAGEKTGDFAVRATVVGRSVSGLDYAATVTARQADTLVRTSGTALTCVAGGEFANQVEVKATYKGAVADGVAATATLIKSAADATENDKGPYFKDADGKTIRTLKGLKTDANGRLLLPKLYADDTPGTFLLRINTTGGATLTVELTVEAAASSSPSTSPSPSA